MMRVVMQAQPTLRRCRWSFQARVAAIVERLAHWPDVAGAKPMRKALKGHYRIRTGDWRVLFQVKADVIVVRIAHRSTVYED